MFRAFPAGLSTEVSRGWCASTPIAFCWREVGTQAGAVRALVPPARIEGTDPVMNDVPALGAHTGAILHELGIEPGTVDVWRTEGIV